MIPARCCLLALALCLPPAAAADIGSAVRERLAAGDRGGAATLLREAAAAEPENLAAQLRYVDFLTDHGRDDAMARRLAVECLENAARTRPAEPEIVRRLFAIHLAAGEEARARSLLEPLAPDDPLRAELTRQAGAAAAAAERERLDEHHELAFRSAPADPALARRAAEYFRESGRIDRAISVLERHLEAAPDSLDLMTRLGIFHFIAGEPAAGEAVLKRVLERDPGQALAHRSLAKHFEKQNQPGPARHHRGEYLMLRGGPATDFLELADDCLTAGEPAAARRLLEKACHDRPAHPGLKMKLAIATRRDPGTRAQSAASFEAAVTAAGAADLPADFQLERAGVLAEAGRPQEAEDCLRAAIRGFPPEAAGQTAAALRQLAGLWESQQRNPDAARALRRRADALEPR